MITRKLASDIRKGLEIFPAVGILGTRQAGKTTLALHMMKEYPESVHLDLELPSDNLKVDNAEFYLQSVSDRLVIIDEIQRRPELFPLLRAVIDRNRRPGRFLILGSSSPHLIKQSSESLAGRIINYELTPLTYDEVSDKGDNLMRHFLRGGYPESFLAKDDESSLQWRTAFILTLLEKDLQEFGIGLPVSLVRRFWTMLARSQGGLWNSASFASALGISAPTVRKYADILQDAYLVRILMPYYENIGKRLVKSPKVYIRDSGLLLALLQTGTLEQLLGNSLLGHIWEGYVIEQILSTLPAGCSGYFYRTTGGAEIDLVITRAEKPVIGIEIKFSSSPAVSKGFFQGMDDLGCKTGMVIYPGKDTVQIKENVFVVPLAKAGDLIKEYV
ncbi:MAG: ATP-binding protein [Ignavibacteriales bacterium]|nr:MAG: ATP-binding protein [Ignavibacteriales bacterium]